MIPQYKKKLAHWILWCNAILILERRMKGWISKFQVRNPKFRLWHGKKFWKKFKNKSYFLKKEQKKERLTKETECNMRLGYTRIQLITRFSFFSLRQKNHDQFYPIKLSNSLMWHVFLRREQSGEDLCIHAHKKQRGGSQWWLPFSVPTFPNGKLK